MQDIRNYLSGYPSPLYINITVDSRDVKYSEAAPQTDKWLCTLNSRLEGNPADAACSMLDTGYK
jgi:hypothetical protein